MSNLIIENKELIKEWDYEKNKDIDINKITYGSSKKVWWKCKNGHEYMSDPHHRSNGVGCPICAGKTIIKGYNDLETTNKDILKYWDYRKNIEIKPSEITKGSRKKVWWKCPKCGYEWNTQIYL